MLLVTNESTKFCDFSTYKLRIMNCVARVIYNCGRQDHVTPLLRDNLHWLRVRERILFKLCLMVYRAWHCLTSPNFAFPLQFVRGLHCGQLLMAHCLNFVPRTRLELGKRAFAVAAPAAWNSLSGDVQSAPTLDKFKQCLKTHLFIQSYYS